MVASTRTVRRKTAPGRGRDLRGLPAAKAVPILVEEYGPRLHALGLRLTGRSADADDIVQDTFLQAFRKWSQFEGRADPGTWLYTIAVRSWRRRRRRRAGEPARVASLDALLPFGERTMVDAARAGAEFSGDSPLDGVERSEDAERLHGAILRLPEPFRVAVVLKDVLELPTPDVAAALGVKDATVKTRVHRARLLLRRALIAPEPKTGAVEPTYERRVCLDLLKAKLAAMDRGRGFPLGQDVLCSRCRAVLAELDLTQNACALLAGGELTPDLRGRIERAIAGAA